MPTPRKPGSMYGWGYREKLAAVVPVGDPDECWRVERGVDRDGYAHLTANDTDETLIHRMVVLAAGVEIPPTHEVDHTCRTRNCANPRHLEVVPKRVNLERSNDTRVPAEICIRGHQRTPDSLYADGSCKACKADNYRKKAKASGVRPRTPGICRRGHRRTPDNLNSKNACKTCIQITGRARRARLRSSVTRYQGSSSSPVQ